MNVSPNEFGAKAPEMTESIGKRASGFGVEISRVPTLTPSDLSLSASEGMGLFDRHLDRCRIHTLVGADDLQLHGIQSIQASGVPCCKDVIIYRRG